MKAMHVNQASK